MQPLASSLVVICRQNARYDVTMSTFLFDILYRYFLVNLEYFNMWMAMVINDKHFHSMEKWVKILSFHGTKADAFPNIRIISVQNFEFR